MKNLKIILVISIFVSILTGCVSKTTGVVKSGNRYYDTVQEFIDDEDSKEGTLIADVSENFIVTRSVSIDLNGYTISNNNDSNPTITVKDNCTFSNGTITGSFSKNNATIVVNRNNLLTLVNMSVDRDGEEFETIELRGSLEIDGGTVHSPNCNVICTYEGDNSSLHIFDNATIIGESEYDVITNHGNCTIDNATLKAEVGYVMDNWSQLVINEGSNLISLSDTAAILNEENGEITINGGNLSSKKDTVINKGTLLLNTSSVDKNTIKNEGLFREGTGGDSSESSRRFDLTAMGEDSYLILPKNLKLLSSEKSQQAAISYPMQYYYYSMHDKDIFGNMRVDFQIVEPLYIQGTEVDQRSKEEVKESELKSLDVFGQPEFNYLSDFKGTDTRFAYYTTCVDSYSMSYTIHIYDISTGIHYRIALNIVPENESETYKEYYEEGKNIIEDVFDSIHI